MIYDKLDKIQNYLGCHPNLDTAIGYILSHDLNALPIGRTEIAGDAVFLNVMEANTASEDTLSYEIHKNYMDIQIDLIGTEIIRIGDSGGMQLQDYNGGTDFGTVRCANLTSCIMGPDNFIVCMAGEPHMPGISYSDLALLKKCVVKVHR